MGEYVLTADEVLYLAALTGAETFYGVEDHLSTLPDMELKSRVMEIEASLENRGYMKTDFDGNASMDEKLVELIAACGDSGNMVGFEKETMADGQSGALYFACSGKAVRMVNKEGQYTFTVITPQKMKEEVAVEINWKNGKEGAESEGEYLILQKDLEKAAKLARRGGTGKAETALTEAGVSGEVAQTVLDAVLNRADFYSILFLNQEAEGDEVSSASVLFIVGKIMVSMSYDTNEKDEDCVIFRVTDEKEQRESIDRGFGLMGCFDWEGHEQDEEVFK